jgi:putative spermidine/putrescine transport system ATP-binding protein
MSQVSLRNITKKYDGIDVLKNIDLTIQDGEFVTLLGPSGCGKSTILRIITGLTDPDAGEVFMDDKNITPIATKNRQVGMVFQSYALFPNLNVYENIAFGLMTKKMPKDEIKKAVDEMLTLVGLEEKIHAYPHELSGGQQQRVALARAIIVKPRVLLLDEPLSALDAQIRKRLQMQLRAIQQELNITMVLVTHDQEEAMHVSDRIFVMSKGEIAQAGTPLDIYTRPNSEFIANFIGNYNVWTRAELEQILGVTLPHKAEKFAVRPEAIQQEYDSNSYAFKATAQNTTMVGNIIKAKFHCNEINIAVEQLHHQFTHFKLGEEYQLYVRKEDVIPLL